jgi:predicted ATPase
MAPPSSVGSPSATAAQAVFRKEGEYWTVGWKGRPFRLKDSKGLAYLAHLLRHPTTEFHALDLVGGLARHREDDAERGPDTAELHVTTSDDAGEMLDDRAKATYRRRLEELRAELDAAKAAGNAAIAEAAEREITSLTAELRRAVGLHGRARRAASTAERARQSVTKTTRAVVERIRQSDAVLGDLLSRCIRTGAFCAYEPDPSVPIEWQFGAGDPASGGEPGIAPPPPDASPFSLVARTPFVGREHERDALRAVVDRAHRGQGSIVLLAGGPGVGKSRLAMEIADRAFGHGFRVLLGHCYERDERFPFLPFAEILESGLAQAANLDDHRRWMGDAAAELAQIAPRLRRAFPDLPEPRELPPQQRRRYLFQSFSEALGRAARAAPRLLLLEDLHWADESTLALLVHLARGLAQLPVVIVGTFRPAADEQHPALERTLEELMRIGIRPLRLGGLSRDDTSNMLEALGARLPSSRLANLIFDVTEGNPFFVQEVYHHLVEDGRVFDAAGDFRSDITIDEIDVPENVRLVIGRRLDRLSDAERKILAAAAVIGRSFSFQLVRLLLEQVDVDELCDAVEKAQRMGLLVASAEGPEMPFTFAHEILRQTLLHGMAPPRRQRLHAGVAHAIERLHPRAATERAGEIAHHLLKAGAFAKRHEVATALLVAGKAALGASAFEQAHRWFESALEYQDDPTLRAEILSVMATTDYGLVQGSDRRLIGRSFVDVVDGLRSRLAIAAGRLTAFVGRTTELATLMDRWEQTIDGQGQSVLLVGEAGVGKSRLAFQFRERLATTAHTWLECGASPYTPGTPFHPVIALVAQGVGVAPADTAAEKVEKIERGLGDLASREHVALLADLLDLPPPTPLALNPDVQRRQTMELLAQWMLARSRLQPLVLLVEDLHWCDASSLQLLGRIMAQSATAHVLVVATARPEFMAPWPARSNLTTLHVERLTQHEARTMVATLLEERLPATTLEALVARADGVPLYVEELTKAMAEPGAARGADTIPTTLAGSLMARLDRLSTAKEVAQRAAVLGREFDYPLLAAVAGMDGARLRQGLARLVDAEMVFQHGQPPDATYTFKHALVQDAAYESLLESTRRQLHGRVVDVLGEQAPERQATELEVMARHADAAGRRDEAITYYGRAGERAQARSAHAEAIEHLRKAIVLLEQQAGDGNRNARELPLQLALGASLMAARGYAHPETALAYERAAALGTAAVDAARFGMARAGLATCYYTRGDIERGRAVSAELLAAGEARSDRDQMLMGHVNVAGPEYYQGKFASSLAHCERAIGLYDPARHHGLVRMLGADQGVAALGYAAWDLWYLGRPDAALVRAEECIALARRLDDPFCVALALFVETALRWVRRDVAAQREVAAQVIALGETQGFPLWLGLGRAFHAWTGIVTGDLGALADLMDGLMLAAETGNQSAAPSTLAMLADAQRAAGLLAEAQGTVATALAIAAQTGQPYCDADLHCLDGDLLLAIGRATDDAAACYHRAIAIARGQGAPSLELRAATRLARLWHEQGDAAAARDLLASVYATFSEGFATPDLRDAKALLEQPR